MPLRPWVGVPGRAECATKDSSVSIEAGVQHTEALPAHTRGASLYDCYKSSHLPYTTHLPTLFFLSIPTSQALKKKKAPNSDKRATLAVHALLLASLLFFVFVLPVLSLD